MVASRSNEAVGNLQKILEPLPKTKIHGQVMVNGHIDPLEGQSVLPDLLVYRLGPNWEVELEAISARPVSQRPAMVIVSSESDPQVMRSSMQAGARDFFVEPFVPEEVLRSLDHLRAEVLDNSSQEDARISVVMNAKGGSGASLIASNLAHALCQEYEQQVALVDLDLQFGSLSYYLDLNLKHGIKEALDNVDDIDAIAMDGYLVKHESGLRVMGVEEGRMILNDEVSSERLRHLIALLARMHHHVVIDVPRQIDLITSTVLEMADQVIVVTQQSITHLRDTARLMDVLRDDLEISDENLEVVVNRFQKNSSITRSEIENTLKQRSLICVPNDYKVVSDSLNDGVPLLNIARKAPITKAIIDLCEVVRGNRHDDENTIWGRLYAKLKGA
ncbi:AAA family ATPase [Pontibacterium granulatum]|uniref:AAA family ATPase n=1 Tax=Pontibacterium granulatum TaxID=2036029 RepID=UPI00249CEA94|nr:AAA family ATPase [Pontibacterium granulatum]MDI3323797.1 AAA family ATPase [Pontibacterium granulatum]